MANNVFIEPNKVEHLLFVFQHFAEDAKTEMENANTHIGEKMDYFHSVEDKLQQKVDEAMAKLEKAQAALTRCESSQRWDEEDGCYKPSCSSEAGQVDKYQREVDKWKAKLEECKAIIRDCESAIGIYREKERSMNTLLNEHMPALEIKMQHAVQKGRDIENVNSLKGHL
jgi:chromosome segregation ATPase